ncbi:unnamed protein product [Prunus armeniaca]
MATQVPKGGNSFEASVRHYLWLGTAMIFFATFHGASTLFIWGVSHFIQEELWEWQKTGRIYLAGEICLVTGLVIWITSFPQIRRKQFEIFYYTHRLYIVFLVFFLFHAGDCHFYMVFLFPGIFLFGLDKLLLIIQSRRETCILSARIFPSKAIELILPKDPGPKYSPTSIIFVKVPSISKYEWHSFSITSSSRVDDNTISVMIKSEGSWTSSLSHMIQTGQESDGDQKKYIPIAVEGPYGPVSMDFLRPNFEADIFAKFPDETGGSDIGVLLYGPETTKESVGHQFARKNVELRSRNPISASTPSISHQKP